MGGGGLIMQSEEDCSTLAEFTSVTVSPTGGGGLVIQLSMLDRDLVMSWKRKIIICDHLMILI